MRKLFRGRREKVKRGGGEASLCIGVDHFWLTGARDEGGSGETLDSEVSPELGGGFFTQRVGHVLDTAQDSN
jgi:hypothetical protein